jgi:hypothetical protein
MVDLNKNNLVPSDPPFYDKNGKEIKEYDLLKMFHFTGVNEQGRGRKHYYLYRWVRLREMKDGKVRWVGHFLCEGEERDYFLLTSREEDRRILDAEVIQSPKTMNELYG